MAETTGRVALMADTGRPEGWTRAKEQRAMAGHDRLARGERLTEAMAAAVRELGPVEDLV